MKIGNLDFGKYPLLLAPMEDVTDESFRLMCKEFGADMVYTEFVSSDALVRNINSTMRKLSIQDAERPVAIQIYGRFVDAMVDAACRCEEANPDVLDINFGCPVKKVAGKGAGAGMLRDIPLMLKITRAVVDAVKIPVTVKTRLGWDHDSKIIVDLAERLQDWRHCRFDHTRTYAQPNVYGRSRLDFDRRGKKQSSHAYPHYRKRRCDDSPNCQRAIRSLRGRCRYGGSGEFRLSVDFQGDEILFGDGRAFTSSFDSRKDVGFEEAVA